MNKLPPKPEKGPRDPVLVREFEDLWSPSLWTWEEAKEAFLKEIHRVRRPATHLDYSKMLSVPELARFAGRRVTRITVDELATVVHEIHDSGRERHAEHLASVLRPMWGHLSKHGVKLKSGVDAPIPGLRAPERTPGDKPRSNGKIPGGHVASPAEIGRALAIARSGAVEETLATALQLLILTGQRRRPVAEALVEDFVPWVETPGWGVWSMGPRHRKTAAKRGDKHRHCVPLPPTLWKLVQRQAARAAEVGTPYLFPQVRPKRAGDAGDGHLSDAALNHRLLDMGILASPHDMRRGLSTTLQSVFRHNPLDVKRILDHNEGVRSDDVLEKHYTLDDRLDLKQPLMATWCAWTDEQAEAVAVTLPAAEVLGAEMARRRRERELAGKGKRAKLVGDEAAEGDKPAANAATLQAA
jgi:integrase